MPGGLGNAYAVAQSEVGISLEAIRGTAAASLQYMIPTKAPDYEIMQTMIEDDTLQGSMVKVQQLVRGMRYDKHGWSSNIYLDSFPLILMGELGSPDTFTIAATPTTLSASAAVGATTITTTAALVVGDIVVVGVAPTLETHKVLSVTTDIATLDTPIIYAQASGAAVTPLNKHEISLLNNGSGGNQNPPSLTVWDFDGEQWRQLTACQIDELNIKGNATSLATYTTTIFGNPALENATNPAGSYTAIQTPAPWTFTGLINGVVKPIVDWEVDLKRGVAPIPALQGIQEYYEYFASALECTAKLTFMELSSSPYLADFQNGVQQPLDFNIYDLKTGNYMNIHSSLAEYKTGKLDRSKEYVEVQVDVQLLPTATDALAGGKSPLLITVGNGVGTQYTGV